MKSYVYLDVLFVINLVVNYLMLLAAGKMMGIATLTPGELLLLLALAEVLSHGSVVPTVFLQFAC